MNEARVPVDYDPNEEEMIERAAQKLAQKVSGRMAAISYTERNGGDRLLKWFLGLLTILLPMAIAGEVILYAKVESNEARDEERHIATQERLARIEKLVDIRMRGGITGEPDGKSP